MGKMTREEVEERLEEYAAYKSIKEAHEDEEERQLMLKKYPNVVDLESFKKLQPKKKKK